MSLFDRFRRRTIRDLVALGSFVDEQAFLLAESSVRDYSRLRAGAGADALLTDTVFGAALDKACWEAYPHALAMTGTVFEAKLRPHAGEKSHAMLVGLVAIIRERFDRRAVPKSIGEADWRAGRTELMRSLNDLAHQRPKSAEMVVHDHSSFYLAIMPLHANLAGDDFPALCNHLKAALLQIEKTFAQRADLPVLAAQLAASPQDTPAKADSSPMAPDSG